MDLKFKYLDMHLLYYPNIKMGINIVTYNIFVFQYYFDSTTSKKSYWLYCDNLRARYILVFVFVLFFNGIFQ